MFFIIGVSQGQKRFDFRQNAVCPCCGRYGAITVFMTFTYLTLFFIPVLKWGKHYFAETSCCGSVCEIDKATGEGIRRGTITELDISKLYFSKGSGIKKCRFCGYETREDFEFCPKCGNKL